METSHRAAPPCLEERTLETFVIMRDFDDDSELDATSCRHSVFASNWTDSEV